MKPTIESAANALVVAIFNEPVIPEPGAPLLTIPENARERQSFRNGYYSVRDLPEFQKLLALLKEAGVYV